MERATRMDEIIWIAIAIFGCALMLPVISKLLSKRHRLLRTVGILLFILYILVNLNETLLFRENMSHAKSELSLLWSYRRSLSLLSESGEGINLSITDWRLLKQIILNILLYIPFGYLLPFAWPKLTEKKGRQSRLRLTNLFKSFPWIVVLIGVTFSMATEFTQLLFKLGLFELDDILNNTIGCLIGVLLYQALMRKKVNKAE
jgi:glycopeptide antibiotics resistance protein